MKIGFIGLGIMGKPMALNVMKAGYELTCFDLNEQAVNDVVKHGANRAISAKEVAEHSDVIFIIVPNSEHVEAVVFGEDGLEQKLTAGQVVVDLSSISPVVSKKIAETLAKKDVDFLDAPVSGGEEGAIEATLAIMAGGPEQAFAKVKPLLACMGKEIIRVGENGAGTTAKLANQIIVNVNIAAVAEAFSFATKAGIDPEKMYQAIRSGLAGSHVLDLKGPKILNRNFEPGGRIDINMKDLTNVSQTAEIIDFNLPLAGKVLSMFTELTADGKQELDHSGLVQYYEKHENIIVKKGGAHHE